MAAVIDPGPFRVGIRVRAFRGARQGRSGTVVSDPSYGSWYDGSVRGQVDVDYDGWSTKTTFMLCLEPLPAVVQLAELLDDQR